MKKLALATLIATTLAAPAFADNLGASVTGTLAFGANGGNGGQYWSPSTTTIGAGTEYDYVDGANHDTADFDATQLTIVDQDFVNANGWEMTFSTPTGFHGFSLVSSDFDPGLTYSEDAGVIKIDWTGTSVGGVTYTAVFNVSTSPVPEPANVALMLAGLGFVGFVARRRKA
ncbi:MAG TPA: PEP-CTERM sorting domain-containing protein [Burkholderiaceae bacterium]